jgi:hypothetical protein
LDSRAESRVWAGRADALGVHFLAGLSDRAPWRSSYW